MSSSRSDDATRRRLGRAVLFILQQGPSITDDLVRADIDTLLVAGKAMSFASRLRGHGQSLTPELAYSYARHAGVSMRDLRQCVLPALKQADIIDYEASADGVSHISEFVGVSGTVIEQTFRVLDALGPSDAELGVLHSVELAAWAPLTESQHLDQVAKRGLPDRAAKDGLRLALAAGINQRVPSPELNEKVVFNPYVWGTGQVEMATFLRNLPPSERDALISIFEQASQRPAVGLDQLGVSPAILSGARKVGLIQAATVKSSRGNRARTYVFGPTMQSADDKAVTTEALHLRKLFVAHILFGQEKAVRGFGKINDPTKLVRALLRHGTVGPATNISTDYHLLESYGVVTVEPSEKDPDKGYLHLIKEEIAEAGLQWLEAGLGGIPSGNDGGVNLRRAPGSFITPERDRATLPDEAAATEIMVSAVLELRKEAQGAARADSAFRNRW